MIFEIRDDRGSNAGGQHFRGITSKNKQEVASNVRNGVELCANITDGIAEQSAKLVRGSEGCSKRDLYRVKYRGLTHFRNNVS